MIEAVQALVLTERNEHLDSLANQLSGKIPRLIVLRGGMERKQRDAAAAEIAAVSNEVGRVLIATGRYIGEGFDDARLDTLFLTFRLLARNDRTIRWTSSPSSRPKT